MKIATVWDDGLETDLKLIELLQKYNLKSSFAISYNTHKNHRVLNDYRHSKYGKKVEISELKHFAPFEILNHSANHFDLAKTDYNRTQTEIVDGRKMLEDAFGRHITGFCYPYGCFNSHCEKILIDSGHILARTTLSPYFKVQNPLFLHPTTRWNHPNLLNLIESGIAEKWEYIIIWGHSYEFDNWQQVEDMCKLLSDFDSNTLADIVNAETH
jgi:peptidoglycan/xylan/chitin deacetylase (PgdA/CDA1 family)